MIDGRIAVLLTFDLNKAEKNVYRAIKKDLAKIELGTFALSNEKKSVRLPYNTYLAVFEQKKLDDTSIASLRDNFRKEVVRVIKSHHAGRSKTFVFVGKKWAWGTRGPAPIV